MKSAHEQLGVTQQTMADALGRCREHFSRATLAGGDKNLWLDELDRLRDDPRTFAVWLLWLQKHAADYACVTPTQADDLSIAGRMHALAKECGDVLTAYASKMEGGFSPGEAAEVREQIRELMCVLGMADAALSKVGG